MLSPTLLKLNALPQIEDLDGMLETASRRTGLTDFGPDFFRKPLDLLLKDLLADPDLHPMGRFFHRVFIGKFIKNRLKLENAWKTNPEILNQDIKRPLIIIGLPRTGTTRLFNILARDPAHRSLSFWEVYRPVPPPEESRYARDPRRYQSAFELAFGNYLIPDLKSIHELRLDGPEECIHLLCCSFVCWLFALEYNSPRYQEWFRTCNQDEPYREYRQQLQLLQSRFRRERWLLKSPAHLWGIHGLLKHFPDACIVQTHRDPKKAIPSCSSLAVAARGAGARRVDPVEVGAQIKDQLTYGLNRTIEARSTLGPDRFFDVQFRQIVDDPMNVIRDIYRHFDLQLDDGAERAMQTEISANPQHAKGQHRYSSDRFGWSSSDLTNVFSDYVSAFDVPLED